MKFSTRATYGLKAMLYLADHYGESAVPVSQIAKEEGISAAYLEQILNRIKKKNWVKSVRGPHGGYVLSAKPSQISVASVLTALGEDIRISKASLGRERKRRRPAAHQASEIFWKQLSEGFIEGLATISLQGLITRARKSPAEAPEPLKFTFNI